MFRPIFIIIFLFILAAFILQMISIFANFNGLRSVYIARIDLDAPSNNNDGGILGSIWNSADSILGGSIPDYLTLGLFVICEGTEPDQTTCTPPSLGFDYTSTGILQTLAENIPQSAQSIIAKVQEGVFIPSVIFCFLLLCYSLFYLCSRREHGICNYIVIEILAILAFLFCLATFVIQYVAFDKLRDEIDNLKQNLFGGLLNNVVTVTTTSGKAIWLSCAAFILLFLVCVLLLFSCCSGRKYRKRRNQPQPVESYEMT